MMGVPEGLKGLLPDPVMCCRVHEEHAQEHDVAGDASGLGVVYLYGCLGPDLRSFDVEKVDVMCAHVDASEDQ